MSFYGAIGVVLDHIVSNKGIEVDKAKVKVVENLTAPISIKSVRRFLGHVGLHRWSIQDFSKIAKPFIQLQVQVVPFDFNEEYLSVFLRLKEALISASIMQAFDWGLSFQVMCDASNNALGVVLGQQRGNKPYAICYASCTLDEAQVNYATTQQQKKRFLSGCLCLGEISFIRIDQFQDDSFHQSRRIKAPLKKSDSTPCSFVGFFFSKNSI